MAAPIISVKNLGKRYQLGATLGHDTLRDHLAHSLSSLKNLVGGNSRASTGGSDAQPTEIWALKEISFDVVRELNGNKITTSYSGDVSADKITGKISFSRNGEVQSHDWQAKRAADQK